MKQEERWGSLMNVSASAVNWMKRKSALIFTAQPDCANDCLSTSNMNTWKEFH
jgi:hypothetical protein